MTERTQSERTKKLVIMAMFTAIIAILGSTPLGFIPIGPMKLTIVHIPVVVGVLLQGPVAGLVLGLFFGLFSMLQAVTAPTVLSPLFLDPLVAVLPRMIVPLTAYASARLAGRFLPKKPAVSWAVAGAVGTLTNTVGVLGMIYIRHLSDFARLMGMDSNMARAAILGTAGTNGIPEAILGVVLVTAVMAALVKVAKPRIHQNPQGRQ